MTNNLEQKVVTLFPAVAAPAGARHLLWTVPQDMEIYPLSIGWGQWTGTLTVLGLFVHDPESVAPVQMAYLVDGLAANAAQEKVWNSQNSMFKLKEKMEIYCSDVVTVAGTIYFTMVYLERPLKTSAGLPKAPDEPLGVVIKEQPVRTNPWGWPFG